jgi:hypothetical protein
MGIWKFQKNTGSVFFRIRIRIQSNIYVATGKEIKFGSGSTFGTDPNLYGKEPVPGNDLERNKAFGAGSPFGMDPNPDKDPFLVY